MIKIRELRGHKSLRALNAFHTLMLGLKMLPEYMAISYESFFERVDSMPHSDKLKLIREAAMFVELQKEEVEAIMSFVEDANGVPYTAENVKNLDPKQLVEAIVSVCGELAKMKIDLVSDDEKKN